MNFTEVATPHRLTRPEAAEYLGVNSQTLANWAYTGKVKIPFHKVGRKVNVTLSDDSDDWMPTCGGSSNSEVLQ